MAEPCVAGTTARPADRRSRHPVIVGVDGPPECRKVLVSACEQPGGDRATSSRWHVFPDSQGSRWCHALVVAFSGAAHLRHEGV